MSTAVQPVAAPSAPAAPVIDPGSPFSADQVIAEITQNAIQQTLAEVPHEGAEAEGAAPIAPTQAKPEAPATPAPNAPTAREDGATWNDTAKRWQKPDGSFAEGAAPVVAQPEEQPALDTLDLPDGFTAVKPVEGRDLATKFVVRDHEGELEVPDLTIEFTANGKTRSEPLDKVVRLAERGVYNEEREQQVLASRSETQRVQSENQQLLAHVQRLAAEHQRVLSSDEAYLEARARFEQENTPQARMERMQAEREAEQQAQIIGQAIDLSNTYFQSSVAPAVEQIAGKFSTVSPDEIGARLILLTNHLRVQLPNGETFIPPGNHQAVNRAILQEIIPWAAALHDDRDKATAGQRQEQERRQKEANDKAEKARIEAQRARNNLGRQARTGRSGNASGTGNANTRETPKPKPINSVDDAIDSALDATFAAMGMERPKGT